MNRLLITELGDTMRTEMKRDLNKTIKSNRTILKTSFPEIKNNFCSSALLTEIDKTQNPLYQKSLSDQALLNLSKVANLSLFGPKNRQSLENHLRDDLQIKKQKDYLNLCLDKQVDRILDDKSIRIEIILDLMSKRKRQLLNELKKLEARTKLKHFHHIPTEQSQFSSLIEDNDRGMKLMSIVNAEGKLLQLKRRYEKQQLVDLKTKQQVKLNYFNFKENQIRNIEALKIMEHKDMESDVKDIFMNKDLSEIRFSERLNEKHVKETEQIWKQHHFPQHRKWLSN